MARSYNINIDSLELLVRPRLWALNSDRTELRQTLERVVTGSLDAMLCNRFEVPAEIVVAFILCMVDPVNWLGACNLWGVSRMSDDLSQPGASDGLGSRMIQPSQLYSMLLRGNAGSRQMTEEMRGRVVEAFSRMHQGPAPAREETK